ncbi:MAG: ATP-binding protein [Bacilli bacterium]|nr:ATP-binding protein [Bacilli bacterium]
MLIGFAGLPGSGKSYFAKYLVKSYPQFIVLDKDTVRSMLFPGKLTDYTSEQDDLCIDIILQAVRYLFVHHPETHVIIDGRTFSKRYQVEHVCSEAKKSGIPVCFVEFICNDEAMVQERIERQNGDHPAKNRDFALFQKMKKESDPLSVPHLTLYSDGTQPMADRVSAFLRYIGE